MDSKLLLMGLVVGVVLISGCTQEVSKQTTQYVCSNGSVVSSPNMCPTEHISKPTTSTTKCIEVTIYYNVTEPYNDTSVCHRELKKYEYGKESWIDVGTYVKIDQVIKNNEDETLAVRIFPYCLTEEWIDRTGGGWKQDAPYIGEFVKVYIAPKSEKEFTIRMDIPAEYVFKCGISIHKDDVYTPCRYDIKYETVTKQRKETVCD